jgi:hypothetical protein
MSKAMPIGMIVLAAGATGAVIRDGITWGQSRLGADACACLAYIPYLKYTEVQRPRRAQSQEANARAARDSGD